MTLSRKRRAAELTASVGGALGFGGWAASAESRPMIAGALYALSLTCAVAAISFLFLPARRKKVSVADWRQQEDRFRRMNKNVEGHYNRVAGSRALSWSVWPSKGGTVRDRDLFMDEARHASRLLRRWLGYSDAKHEAWFGTDEVDQWLNAIHALIDAGTDMKTSGTDFSGQKSEGRFFLEIPIMSANACVKFAADVRPRIGVPSNLE